MRRVFVVLAITCAAGLAAQSPPSPAADPLPQSVDEFRASAARVLAETGVPGAGIALVRRDGIEWEGGIGYADRDRHTPVTADTHFRVGSISKTFVAMALVQLSEDGMIDFDAPVKEIAADIDIDNPWEATHPVRVINVLQHTAGFDDMHFNESYLPEGERERPLADVLTINPHSRRVRWPPGTRMAYSNPGYAVAGLLIEKISGLPYEDYIEREIFAPLAMSTSSFRLRDTDEHLLARGYEDKTGPPVGFPRIYMRPAGNMHSSAHELARFVQMLLGWGELGSAFVVDPEYLGNMEQPRTTLAARAGLRNGYGSGIATRLDLPFKLLGHNGGIAGFHTSYAYSPSRDVGFVILLNSTARESADAMRRLSTLAIRYLKLDIEPPQKPGATVSAATLDRYVGYYQEANPRNQFTWPLQSLLAGWQVTRDGSRLTIKRLFSAPIRLLPVTESTFRLEDDLDASYVFTTDDAGVMVMTGSGPYAERVARWRIDALRAAIAGSVLLVASTVVMAIVWIVRARRAVPRGFWELKIAMLLCPLAVFVPLAVLAMTSWTAWGVRNRATVAVFVGTGLIPVLALVVGGFTLAAARQGASRSLTTYAGFISLAMAGLSLYLSYHGILPLRIWTY